MLLTAFGHEPCKSRATTLAVVSHQRNTLGPDLDVVCLHAGTDFAIRVFLGEIVQLVDLEFGERDEVVVRTTSSAGGHRSGRIREASAARPNNENGMTQ